MTAPTKRPPSAWCHAAAALAVPLGHLSCAGTGEIRLPAAPEWGPVLTYQCGCPCHEKEMTMPDGPWIGDLVHDPVTGRRATLSDVSSSGTYTLRAPGAMEWPAEDPARLEIVTRRADRDDWPSPTVRH